MKRQILLFAGLLLASASQAQITLTASSYPAPSAIIGVDSLQKTTATSTFPPNLTATTNATWDMSTITDTSEAIYNCFLNPDTSEAQFADSSSNSFLGASYTANAQVAITSSGLVNYGVDIDSQTIVSTSATIFIPVQHTVFSSPDVMIAFPATMSSSWTSNYISVFNYDLIAPISSTGAVKSTITEMDTVVGYGEMRVPTLTGSPSAYFHVLQVQVTTTTVDSFSLGGSYTNPELSLLFSATGLSQGQTTSTYEQRYYRSGDVTPFARVEYANNTFSSPTSATTDAQRLVNNGVANVVNTSGVNIYPNPVTANVISIDLPALSGAWTYELTDISGRSIAVGALTTNGTHAQLSLPVGAAPGIYNIRLANNGNQICVRSLEIAK